MDLEALQRNYRPIDLGAGQPKQGKKKDFWTDQISTAGGILGGIAGIPLGIFGAAGGSAAGSGLGEALENILMGEDITKNVGKEALLGGVLGAGPLRLGGAIVSKVAPRSGKTIEQAGKNLLGTQANLGRAQGRQLGKTPAETLGAINERTGLTDMSRMADVGQNVTGNSGALTELTKNAIGNSKGVDISDLRRFADALLTDKAPLITDSARKNVLNQVKNSTVKAYGGSKGSLNTLANPYDAFDVARNFEASAARIRGSYNASPSEQQLADVYDSLAKEIKNRLFSAPGVNEGVQLAKGATAETFRQLAKTAPSRAEKEAYEKLAAEADTFTDVAQIRAAQAPFVQLNKIDRATAQAQYGAAAQMGDNLQGAGRILQRPTNIVALPLNAATPAIGGAITNLGRRLQSPAAPLTRQGVAGRVAAGGAVSGLINESAQPATLEDALMAAQSPVEAMPATESQPAQENPYPRENLLMDIQRDPSNAEEYIKYYQQMQELFPQQLAPELNASQQKTAVTAQNALNDIAVLEQAIQSGDINKKLIPFNENAVIGGALGTNTLNAALFNIGDVILRSRTGAAAPKEEVEKFISGYLPRGGESPETQAYKLKRAYNELLGMVSPPTALGVGTASSLEDALMAIR